jgi:2-polyprenyl-6-methoxyphenol hydroxylase-like FAD-dependent oxidoreductase
VDASGRYSALAEWLTALGLTAPRVEEVELETHYASRIYARRPHHLNGGIALAIVANPVVPRGGVALALDDQRWIVSLHAIGGARPPRDHAALVAFARTLTSPALAEILEDSEPLSETHTLRFPSSIRRRYEDLPDFPRGLLVCADALASFNPTFGQGITVAALEAVLLRDLVERVAPNELGKVFLERARPIVDVAWDASVGPALLYPGVVGRPTLKMRIANAYLPRVIARAQEDPFVATTLLRVMQFLAPPAALFAPGTMLRVLGLRRAETNVSPVCADGPATSVRLIRG